MTTRIDALRDELLATLGPDAVADDLPTREKHSVDSAAMSPLLAGRLPLGLADLVAIPADAEGIAVAVAASVRHGVPVTVRGKGTGNYGQSIPTIGGLVVSTTRARAIGEVRDGTITAEAGASLVALEQAAGRAGSELWVYPSTAHSTLGGFVAGGWGGTGTIAHGPVHAGFVAALDVVYADGTPTIHRVEGDAALAHLHTYGTTGVIVRATVRTDPRRDWRTVYASFDDFAAAAALLRPLAALHPTPRLVSADPAEIAAALPTDDAIPAGRASLRTILAPDAVAAAREAIEAAGGRIEAEREGGQAMLRASMISYNHPIQWFQHSRSEPWFHLEVNGDALVDRLDDVLAAAPATRLHLEAGHGRPVGAIAAPFTEEGDIRALEEALERLGVGVHSPHHSSVDFELARAVATAARTDPRGLLNPGKLDPDYAGPQKGDLPAGVVA